jgi:hypothetical protein
VPVVFRHLAVKYIPHYDHSNRRLRDSAACCFGSTSEQLSLCSFTHSVITQSVRSECTYCLLFELQAHRNLDGAFTLVLVTKYKSTRGRMNKVLSVML